MRKVFKGERYGMWAVLEDSTSSGPAEKVECLCDCGMARKVRVSNLKSDLSTGCGCKRLEVNRQRLYRHGYKADPLYQTWSDMMGRCYNPEFCNFEYYGGRGIAVCEEWADFEVFRADMGPHPGKGFSIDREENDGNYEKGNCRWVTQKVQARNSRRNVSLTMRGETLIALDWAQKLRIPHSTVYYRLRTGRSLGLNEELSVKATTKEFREMVKKARAKLFGGTPQ